MEEDVANGRDLDGNGVTRGDLAIVVRKKGSRGNERKLNVLLESATVALGILEEIMKVDVGKERNLDVNGDG